MELLAPFPVKIKVTDPAPLTPTPARPFVALAPPALGPGCNSAQGPPKAALPPQVLQEFQVEFRLYVARNPLLSRALTFPFAWGKEPSNQLYVQHVTLSIDGEDSSIDVRLKASAETPIRPCDEGPVFREVSFLASSAVPATLRHDGTYLYPSGPSLEIKHESLRLPWELPKFLVSGITTDHILLVVTLGHSRKLSKSEWRHFNCKTEPEPKCALLESAERTGDLVLVGGASTLSF